MTVMGPDKVRRAIERSLEARVRSVGYVAMGYWYYEWDWGEAIAYDGLDLAANLLVEDSFTSFVDAGVRRWAAEDSRDSLRNRMGPVACALTRIESDSATWSHLRPPIQAFCDAIAQAPRSAGGSFLLDAPLTTIFVDTLYAEPAALAQAARYFDDQRYVKLAVDLCLGHCRLLQDERSGLFRHYCETATMASPPILWGRGNGWALLGLADLVAALPSGRSIDGDEVVDRFRLACRGAMQLQDPGGAWRNIVDDEASAIETSTSALVATAFLIGVAKGVLEAKEFAPAATRAWAALGHRVEAGGTFAGVSFRPGVNSDPSRYEHVPFSGNFPWGQGAYLRLAAAWRQARSSGAIAAKSDAEP